MISHKGVEKKNNFYFQVKTKQPTIVGCFVCFINLKVIKCFAVRTTERKKLASFAD